MKYKYLLLLLFSLLFFSCEMKKEILGQTDKGQTDDTTVENQGLLDLELKPEKEADIPVSKGGSTTGSQTVILDVNEFAIDIIDVNGNTVKHYDSYADLKNEGGLLLPAGHYSIRATLGEDVNAGFDKPFYSGTNVCEITPQEVAKVITDCVLSNKKVTFRCSDDFLKKFAFVDLNLATYGLVIATNPEKDSIGFRCQKKECGKQFNHTFLTRSLIDFDTAGDKYLEEIRKIAEASSYEEYVKIAETSDVRKVTRMKLPASKYVLEVGPISMYDYLENVLSVINRLKEEEEEAEEAAAAGLGALFG